VCLLRARRRRVVELWSVSCILSTGWATEEKGHIVILAQTLVVATACLRRHFTFCHSSSILRVFEQLFNEVDRL
jgi:hypothetical protein